MILLCLYLIKKLPFLEIPLKVRIYAPNQNTFQKNVINTLICIKSNKNK